MKSYGIVLFLAFGFFQSSGLVSADPGEEGGVFIGDKIQGPVATLLTSSNSTEIAKALDELERFPLQETQRSIDALLGHFEQAQQAPDLSPATRELTLEQTQWALEQILNRYLLQLTDERKKVEGEIKTAKRIWKHYNDLVAQREAQIRSKETAQARKSWMGRLTDQLIDGALEWRFGPEVKKAEETLPEPVVPQTPRPESINLPPFVGDEKIQAIMDHAAKILASSPNQHSIAIKTKAIRLLRQIAFFDSEKVLKFLQRKKILTQNEELDPSLTESPLAPELNHLRLYATSQEKWERLLQEAYADQERVLQEQGDSEKDRIFQEATERLHRELGDTLGELARDYHFIDKPIRAAGMASPEWGPLAKPGRPALLKWCTLTQNARSEVGGEPNPFPRVLSSLFRQERLAFQTGKLDGESLFSNGTPKSGAPSIRWFLERLKWGL